MTAGSVKSIERNAQKADDWVADLAVEMGHEDGDEPWRLLCAAFSTCCAIDSRLTKPTQLAAQMPHLVRGVLVGRRSADRRQARRAVGRGRGVGHEAGWSAASPS
jgi:uncharacterized protein (DUF2267 family)